MAIRVFNFKCKNEHVTEHFVSSETTSVSCKCGEQADRVVSCPTFKLDGITGSFPTASDAWARKHEQAAAVANAKYERHGSL